MKIIYTILLFLSTNTFAAKYYVSNAGSDAANGLTAGTSWQTVSKVNGFSFSSGDSILFNSGDTWNEKLVVPASNLYIGSYGIGNKPVLTGFQTLGGFANVSNIWTATATNATKTLNTVLVGGNLMAKGRFPNTGYLTFTSYSGDSSITGSLTGTPDYTGAGIAIRTTHWIIDAVKVKSQSGGTLTLTPKITYAPQYNGNGYFIQNIPSVLDSAGEWCFDSTTNVFKVYSTTTPTVQISSIDTLVYLHNKNNVVFEGISFSGGNRATMFFDTSRGVTIKSCNILNSGGTAITAFKSALFSALNDSIQNSLSGGIYLVDTRNNGNNMCDSATISGDYFKNIGYLAGMGFNGDGKYECIYNVGLHTTITNNRIDSAGYIGIVPVSTGGLIKNNYITNYCFVKDDGGAIYSGSSDTIRSNILINGIGAGAGTSNGAFFAVGIYLDDFGVSGVVMDSNTISKSIDAGIFLSNNTGIAVKDNRVVDSLGAGIRIAQGSSYNLKRNILYAQNTAFPCLSYNGTTGTSQIDSNYYLKPIQISSTVNAVGVNYTLPAWSALYGLGWDVHSSAPSGITSALPLFYYNPTLQTASYTLSGSYIDSKGTIYTGGVSLPAFQSILLFKSIIDYSTGQLKGLKFRKFKKA